jgi:S-DNA-T family DNA segregation ATPase FtsK/SpoIIIE
VIAVADHADAPPPGLGAVVHLASPRVGTLASSGRPPVDLVPELLSSAEAADWADRVEHAARRAGLAALGGVLPERLSLGELPDPPEHALRGRGGLRVGVGLGADGPFELDLAVGPHALVAGTSGSGKSEFLLAWLIALALAYPPDRVAFLLVDFKGGAAFEPIAGLPHVTCIVTDLDEQEAARAVASIRAELRRREQVLRSAGARDLAVLDERIELPRLVVVVDEFQAMVERFPELGEVIADVAARGRSLGVHLVLASQRPNGVVRDQVTANCGIRVSLRVLQRSDSLAVVGTDAAALIEPGRPGRAVGDPGDGRAVRFQSALADAESIDLARRRHAGARPPRRPWLDPLPRTLTLETIDAVLAHGRPPSATSAASATSAGPGSAGAGPARVLLGVADDPGRQRRLPAEWRPLDDGPLAVLGAPRSGRSALLNAVAAQVVARRGSDSVVRIEGSRGRAWDAVHRIADSIGTSGAPALVVVDDLDAVFAAWPDDYRFAALARLEELLRNARDAGVAVAASAVRLTGLGAGLRDAFTVSALLRHASRADLVHAGGAGAAWSADAPPGSGQWRGRSAQFLAAGRPNVAGDDGPEALDLAGHPVVAVAAAVPEAAAATLAAHAPHAEVIRLGGTAGSVALAAAALEAPPDEGAQRIVVGDAEAWASNWSLASAARARATIVVHGGHAEYRSLARVTSLPPLLDEPARQCWIVPIGGPIGRRGWPPPKTTESARQGR